MRGMTTEGEKDMERGQKKEGAPNLVPFLDQDPEKEGEHQRIRVRGRSQDQYLGNIDGGMIDLRSLGVQKSAPTSLQSPCPLNYMSLLLVQKRLQHL